MRLGHFLTARDLARKVLARGSSPSRPPVLSFGSWEKYSETGSEVIQICHPDWRGVRTVANSVGAPLVQCDDLAGWGNELLARFSEASISMVVIQGWPPGAAEFAARLAAGGINVKCVLHSSPAQHGAESGEAEVVDQVLGLNRSGVLSGVGMAKMGVHQAFASVGHPVAYVPNRVPRIPEISKLDLGPGLHVGVFAEPFWRKNVVTQLLAVGLLDGAVAHVMKRPAVGYLDDLDLVEHGELPWEEFVALQGSVDLNMYVTLSECHPSTPQESYLTGVPCIMSRVSGVFREDDRLWELTTTDLPDDPSAIADAGWRLLDHREEAVTRATEWMKQADVEGATRWERFISE